MDAFLRMNIIDGPSVGVVYTLALGALIYLAVRRPTRHGIIAGVAALIAGSVAALVTLWIVSATNAFGVDLSTTTSIWVILTFAAICFAVVNLWRSNWVRRVIASVAIVLFAVTGTVAINADFGLDRTVADLAGISIEKPISLPKPDASRTPLAGEALWSTWVAPKDQRATGTTGTLIIPNTLSGFHSRPAAIYLPPAALVKNPPALPLVIMLMGQPGNPDPTSQKLVLDAFAARHNGLAPIVLVPDQLGDPTTDPLCLDTALYGKSETFLVGDVVAWARANLHVLPDAAHWTIAGFSNGGQCAVSLGAKHPKIWGNVLDISGEEYPGSDRPIQTLAQAFAGNTSAYLASRPLTVLAAHHYSNTVGIFTVGSNDAKYMAQAKTVEAAAHLSGWKTTYFEVPDGGHVIGALIGGLQEGYRVLYPRLGLSDPTTAP